jgi:hypothetical protein
VGDYQAFAARDLSEHQVLYLFVNGIAERLHPVIESPAKKGLDPCRPLLPLLNERYFFCPFFPFQ